jgi:hypothetical protein
MKTTKPPIKPTTTKPFQLTPTERNQLELVLPTLATVKLRTINIDGDITYLTANLAIDAIRYILNQADKATDE